MADKKTNLENLELQAQKKKNKILLVIIILIFGSIIMSFLSYFTSIDRSKVYKKRELDKMEDLEVIKNPEFKESWAISVENNMKKMDKRIMEVTELVKNSQNSMIGELKKIINENNENMNAKISLIQETTDKRIEELKKLIETKIGEQNAKIEQIQNMQTNKYKDIYNEDNIGEDIIIGEDMLPRKKGSSEVAKPDINTSNEPKSDSNETADKSDMVKAPKLKNEHKAIEPKSEQSSTEEKSIKESEKQAVKNKKERKKSKQKRTLAIVNIDTSFNQKLIKKQNEIIKKNEIQKELKFGSYHISTGFGQAYMITGAYAPVFQEGSMEPLPVLFETEGDILMSNDVNGNLEKCFLLGSAKGNMNSETADIKLVSISCLIDGGKYRIEGSISGWVIGENNTPGLQGEMIHKNGAWLARTFVSGFFSTFSQALSGGQVTPINLGTTGTTTTTDTTTTTGAVGSNLMYAGAMGISNVFSKLGDYYIKMAEQIFPIIEVKGGRTVSILLIGGEDLTVVENNKVDIEAMNEMAKLLELEKQQKEGKISEVNAFSEIASEDTGDEQSPAKTEGSGNEPFLGGDSAAAQDSNNDLEDIPEIIK